jgi:hypothetical protein
MLVTHAITLAQARSCVAALADRARTIEVFSGYEHALLELDWIHGDDVPALDTVGLTDDRDLLLGVATAAVEKLGYYGVDPLGIELVLAALEDARVLDEA